MRAIASQAALVWYRKPWQSWPLAFQTVALLILLSTFSGLCFGAWELFHAQIFSNLLQQIGHWLSGFSVLGNTCHAVAVAVAAAAKQLGTGFMVGCLVALALGYAIFMGLGTVCVRLALARR
jgi:hypothetical protein